MGRINKEWHLANRMPKNPTEEERMRWHLDHARNCRCRELPDGVRALLMERGIDPDGLEGSGKGR